MSEKAYIFANGELSQYENVKSGICQGDFLVAADGGSRHLNRMGLIPDLLIGDLDSIDPDYLVSLESSYTIIEKAPKEKDETDLELAIIAVVKCGLQVIRIAGALGGRIDHTLGNISLLLREDLAGCDVRLIDGEQEVFLIRDYTRITGAAGDIVSLIPWGNTVHGVSTSGLQYPLHAEALCPDKARGISNVMVSDTAEVRRDTGILVCVHLFSNTGNQ